MKTIPFQSRLEILASQPYGARAPPNRHDFPQNASGRIAFRCQYSKPGCEAGMSFLYFFLHLSLLCLRVSHASTDYHEKLLLQPLPPASLLASFNFRSNASLESFEQQHFRFLPRSLGQILQHAKTRELHLRFSTGRWDAENWGTRPWGGAKEGGTGVELWAWVEAETEEEYVGVLGSSYVP